MRQLGEKRKEIIDRITEPLFLEFYQLFKAGIDCEEKTEADTTALDNWVSAKLSLEDSGLIFIMYKIHNLEFDISQCQEAIHNIKFELI